MKMKDMSRDALIKLKDDLLASYESLKSKDLKLDMSRGKPCGEQMEISMPLLDVLSGYSPMMAEDGLDTRNYGGFDGIPEAKRLLGEIMDVPADMVFVGSSSSLSLMHDLMSFCYLHPLPECDTPWCRQERVKFLCPSPGYDRHFAVSQHFGIELVTVPMTPDGPCMDTVEQLVADPAVKGMWCVPKYSNPQGYTYSRETVDRMAALRPAAKDFRIFCDNAYAVHTLYGEGDTLPNMMEAFQKEGNEDLLFIFCSFAKITFGGGGIAGIGAAKANMEYIHRHMALQVICNDKVNQLRHARYFGNLKGIKDHMKKHADILRPKFEIVENVLKSSLEDLDIATWTNPVGGYFISLDTLDGCAKKVVALCKEAGVLLTPAGATFPYGKDPRDSNIRIAPTYPGLDELEQAARLLCLCITMVSVDYYLNK